MHRIQLVCLLAGLCSLLPVRAATIPLAVDGQAQCQIVVPASGSEVERFAEAELARYLNRITGGTFAVVAQPGLNKPAIVLGRLETRSSVEAYSISVKEGNIYLEGASSGAVLFAVYDFLEQLGCRWLAPEFGFYAGQAEAVPANGTLSFETSAGKTTQPQFAIRKLDVAEGLSHDLTNLLQLVAWMPKARFNTLMLPMDFGAGRVQWDHWRVALTPELKKRGIRIEVGGHGYENFIWATAPDPGGSGNSLHAAHPDWFGLNEKGERDRSKRRVFCTSNRRAAEFVASQVVTYLKQRPEIDIFDFWPPDGARWCECEPCQALGEPQDRQALLLQQVRDALNKAGCNTRLEIIAYSRALLPPRQAALQRETLVDFCPINQSFESPITDPANSRNAEYLSALKAWRKFYPGDLALYSYYRKYAWRSLPVILPRYLQQDLQYYASVPLQGVHVYAEPGDWATYELNHYTLGKLAWEPAADVDQIVNGFCQARYRDCADLARTLLGRMEALVRTTCSVPFTGLKTPEQIASAQEELGRLAKRLETSLKSSEPGSRAALFRLVLCLEYVLRDLSIQHERARKAPAPAIRTRVESLVKFLQENPSAGVFVLTGRGDLDRFLKRYGLTDPNDADPQP